MALIRTSGGAKTAIKPMKVTAVKSNVTGAQTFTIDDTLCAVIQGNHSVGDVISTATADLDLACIVNEKAFVFKANNTNGFNSASISGDTLSFSSGGANKNWVLCTFMY